MTLLHNPLPNPDGTDCAPADVEARHHPLRTWAAFAVLAAISWPVAVLSWMAGTTHPALVFLALPLVVLWGSKSQRQGRALITFLATALPAWPAAAVIGIMALLSASRWAHRTLEPDTTVGWWLGSLSAALLWAPFVATWSVKGAWPWLVTGLAISGVWFAGTAELLSHAS